jgi:hypothetical protein
MQWLILHSLQSFSEHSDMIGVWSMGNHEPIDSQFSQIRKSDKVVYYAIRDCVIVGIFEVTSGMVHIIDPKWGPTCAYSIRPLLLPPSGKVLDFRSLIRDDSISFDLMPVKKRWSLYLRGHACRPLSDRDYQTLANEVTGSNLIPLPQVKPP